MTNEMVRVANALVETGKGILAADESFPSIEKRLKSINLPSTEENRRDYRGMLFTAPGANQYISGVILFDETLRQADAAGKPFVETLQEAGIIPGIKVDMGAKPLAGHPGELVTEGLDGLRGRLEEYYRLGARFAKWRAVITIGDGIPSRTCIESNAHGLARYAALCQEAGLVPIVEPEVLMDGSNSLEVCEDVSTRALSEVFSQLIAQRVILPQILLKPNMVIAGKKCAQQASVDEVAAATVRTLKRCVPAAVPGIVFLSGGQSPVDATLHLNAMNAMGPLPWKLSFSYGRALQAPALATWKGQAANVAKGQQIFLHRAMCNSAASLGKYSEALEASFTA